MVLLNVSISFHYLALRERGREGGCVPSPWFLPRIFLWRTQSIVGEGEVPTPRAILTGTSNRNSWFQCCGTGIVLMQSGFSQFYAYKRRLKQICRRCQLHWWQIMVTISGCWDLKVSLKKKLCLNVDSTTRRCLNKILKLFWLKNFSTCHRCQWHR